MTTQALDETAEEWSEDEPPEPLTDADRQAIGSGNRRTLDRFARLATSIERNAKGKALVKALAVAFKKAAELGAAEKAIIFTESRDPELSPIAHAGDTAFQDGLVLFNGRTRMTAQKQFTRLGWKSTPARTRLAGQRRRTCVQRWFDYFAKRGKTTL